MKTTCAMLHSKYPWPARLACWLGLLGLLGLAGASQAGPGVLAPGADIRIGMVNAQTGPAAGLGIGMALGAEAVFRRVNAAGGVHGRKLVLKVADDGYEPEQTVDQTLRMVQDEKVLALFGYVGTPTVNAVLPMLADLKLPLVGVFSGAMSLRQPVLPQVFNVRASYDQETELLVTQLLADGARTVAVVHQNDGFGMAVLSGTARALQRRGVKVHARGTFQRNTVALRMALNAMLEARPDAIVLAGPYEPVATFVRKARKAGLTSRLATVSFVGVDSLVDRLQGEGEGMLVSQVVPFTGDDLVPVVRDCRNAVLEHAGVPLGYVSLEGCIAAKVLVHALEKVGPQLDSGTLRASLDGLDALDLGGLAIHLAPDRHQAADNVFLTRIAHDGIVPMLLPQRP